MRGDHRHHQERLIVVMDHALHELHVGVRVVVVVKGGNLRDDRRGLPRGARLNNGRSLSLGFASGCRLAGRLIVCAAAGAQSHRSNHREARNRQCLRHPSPLTER